MRKMTPIKVTEPIAKPKVAANPTPTPSVDARDKYKSKYEKYKSKYDKSKRHAAYHKKRKKKKGSVVGTISTISLISTIGLIECPTFSP